LNIIAVDWGKNARKRSAYLAAGSTRTVSRLPFDGSLAKLLAYAADLEPPTLVGIDAAIGYPIGAWNQLAGTKSILDTTFVDFFLRSPLPEQFFEPVRTPDDWSPSRPFIRPPHGPFSLNAYIEASHDGIHRQIDRRLKANPVFIMCGMPGTVGSGTHALWQELRAEASQSAIRIWPFDGSLDQLIRSAEPIIAEIYPKACYGIALADTLPSPLITIKKTKQPAREDAIERLLPAPWVANHRVTLLDTEQAIANEDDFDALFSAAALLRLYLEDAPFESSGSDELRVEGDILGSGSILAGNTKTLTPRADATPKVRPVKQVSGREYPCPIPGCDQVFHDSRGGWDAHVASPRRHPNWHPEVKGPTERKRLFKREFPDFFM